ncbi:MAG: heme lyase CcmF/NrfE family subunit [Paracoccaceae bacterium]|nr:heme lyase CcmF/NrfE family subunit [Paracoccaceae bacterium]
MSVEFSQFSVLLAFVVACIGGVVPLVGAGRNWTRWMLFAVPSATLQFLLVGVAFAGLTAAFVTSDFSVRLVADNSHSLKPLIYRVTGVWGNHEGSMLLWVLILVFYGALVAWFGNNLPLVLRARVLAVQSLIAAAFLAFVLFTSNPFERLSPPPLDGNDLNPLLQDPGLALHPPFLYLGYVGLSLTFSFAVAALIGGRVDAAWARWVRPWALLAWTCLTIGIALGSWWAYYELGWGGWWFWDPVENASLMPWLVATALLHSAIVAERRDTLKSWTVFLALVAFAFSLIGTFIVRSGVLTSVHAFADDPGRGLFILVILTATICGSLILFVWRSDRLVSSSGFAVVSRESGLILNNLLLSVATLVVFLGTIWPLIAELAWDRKLSVGPPFFESAFTPFMVLLIVALPVGATMPWKRGSLTRSLRSLRGIAAIALAIGCLVWVVQTGGPMLAPMGAALSAWLILAAVREIWIRARWPHRRKLSLSLAALRRLPRSEWGKALAHAGLGVAVFGMSAITAWETEDIRLARPGDSFRIAGHVVHFRNVSRRIGANYLSVTGTFDVVRAGSPVAVLSPEKRTYLVSSTNTTEAAIDVGFWRDLYMVLGDRQDDGRWVVRTYVKPMAVWIWSGVALMAAGGLISLSDRRFRIGAGNRRRSTVPAPTTRAKARQA